MEVGGKSMAMDTFPGRETGAVFESH